MNTASRALAYATVAALGGFALIVGWFASIATAQFCSPTCKCALTTAGPGVCYFHEGGAQCFSTSGGGSITLVLSNTSDGCCVMTQCAARSCGYDISITANADTGCTCCFRISTYHPGSGTSTCVAGDCGCVCTTPVASLGYTATGLTLICDDGLEYYVHECSVNNWPFAGFTPLTWPS